MTFGSALFHKEDDWMSGKQIFVLSLVGSFVALTLGVLLARPTQLYIVSAGRDFCGLDGEGKKGSLHEPVTKSSRRNAKL